MGSASLAMALAALLGGTARAAEITLCPGVVFQGADVGLTPVERRLVCGDPENEGWREIPRAQARRFLEAFLEKRGRLHPVFIEEGAGLRVDPGPVTDIARLEGENLPPGIDLTKKRKVRGTPLTPAALDRVKAHLVRELENRGYACPSVEMSADADSATVRARFPGGLVSNADPIEQPDLPGVDPGIFRRFEAFERGKPLDRRLLDLTSRRVVAEALFLNSYYDVSCATDGARIVHRVGAAPPRIVRIGIGVDTQGSRASARAGTTLASAGARARPRRR
ncbi:MAG: hypothetical protein M0D55_11725 [Elusimicrobiota bacterium]|nr:MAG: hypothetical protein M0D55_11725 [Elusimicrobiota bacterium]